MTSPSAAFFAWVQGAPFYADAHAAAVELLPPGAGRTWLDVGCGPGLVARLAARRGYDAVGVDRAPGMVRAARRRARGEACRFEVGDVESAARDRTADVVSAASLLFVLPDPRAGLELLWRCVRPGGALLVVETTAEMTPSRAREARALVPRRRRLALTLWARARAGRALDRAVLDAVDAATRERHVLLDGMLEAWVLGKAAAPTAAGSTPAPS